jgi:prepilin-type N-terminal cleavage/methylation domain-containing protein
MNKTKGLLNISSRKTSPNAFTLIELVVVIGILAVLLAIVLIAINPAKQFKQANDTKRRSDVNAILNAIGQFSADHKGVLPTGIPVGVAADAVEIAGGAGTTICSQISPLYISAVPIDPSQNDDPITNCVTSTVSTGYTVVQDTGGRVTVYSKSTPAIYVMR